MINYQIKFVEGELTGNIYKLSKDSLSIGRSQANAIRIASTDISGRHLILSLDRTGVSLECLSLRRVEIDSKRIDIGQRIPLLAGQIVKVGESNAFVLESLEDISPSEDEIIDDSNTIIPDNTAIFNTSSSMQTFKNLDRTESTESTIPPQRSKEDVLANIVFEKPKDVIESESTSKLPDLSNDEEESDDDLNQTVALKTRMATPEEIEFMRTSHENQKKKKFLIVTLSIITLVVSIMAIYWLFIYQEPERYIKWPQRSDGSYIEAEYKLSKLPFAKSIVFSYPNAVAPRIQTEDGAIHIDTFIGRDKNVNLRVHLEYSNNISDLKINRREAFEKWIKVKQLRGENWNFDVIQPIAFYEKNSGIPYLSVQYTYNLNNESYFGIAEFLRIGAWQIVLRKEIPNRERWRGENFVKYENMLFFSKRFVNSHWEGTSSYVEVMPQVSIKEAENLMERNAPSLWSKIDFLVRNSLISSVLKQDEQSYSQAIDLLVRLREAQSAWYNAQRISYSHANLMKNEKSKRRITENCKAIFSSEDDRRFHSIRQSKWD